LSDIDLISKVTWFAQVSYCNHRVVTANNVKRTHSESQTLNQWTFTISSQLVYIPT